MNAMMDGMTRVSPLTVTCTIVWTTAIIVSDVTIQNAKNVKMGTTCILHRKSASIVLKFMGVYVLNVIKTNVWSVNGHIDWME